MILTDEQQLRLENLERAVRQSHIEMLRMEGQFYAARDNHENFKKMLAEEQERLGMGQQELPYEEEPSTS
jgi:hypothetical protein